MKTLTVKLPDGLVAEIEGVALARDVNPSVVVKEWLEKGKGKTGSLWSRMEDLVIHDEALPTDLSINKKYPEGYRRNRQQR